MKQTLITTDAFEWGSDLSHDGQWLAYASNETGRMEIYVRPFPDINGGKWLVSSEGGTEPLWGPEGRELFYRDGDAILAVQIDTSTGIRAGTPIELFEGRFAESVDTSIPSYDVAPDGQRFLLMKDFNVEEARSSETPLLVVENWFEELNRLAPPSELAE
ncbi:MAG: hypothetical protein HOM55_05350 [Proteobacteria bacterium]|nr:hypothetical protein [Pseudomonadota bacterium]